MILTRTQVTELSGYRKPSCQIKWLKRQGLRVQNACPIWCGFHELYGKPGFVLKTKATTREIKEE